MILDKAGAKGTGKWTSQDAMDIGVPIPTIDMAVTMRNISAMKTERTNAAAIFDNSITTVSADKAYFVQQVHDALYFGVLISYTQGLAMLHRRFHRTRYADPHAQRCKSMEGRLHHTFHIA